MNPEEQDLFRAAVAWRSAMSDAERLADARFLHGFMAGVVAYRFGRLEGCESVEEWAAAAREALNEAKASGC